MLRNRSVQRCLGNLFCPGVGRGVSESRHAAAFMTRLSPAEASLLTGLEAQAACPTKRARPAGRALNDQTPSSLSLPVSQTRGRELR